MARGHHDSYLAAQGLPQRTLTTRLGPQQSWILGLVCSSLRKFLSPNQCGRPVLYKQAVIRSVPHLRWPLRAVRAGGGQGAALRD